MSYFPGIGPSLISSATAESLGARLQATSSADLGLSATYTANRAYFVPFTLQAAITVAQLWIINAATVAGNVDVGIYNEAGTRQVSAGSTAQSGTTAMQVFDVANTALPAGRYYFAFAASDATATVMGVSDAAIWYARSWGMLYQDAAFALPATATFAAPTTNTRVPLVGLTTLTTI